MSSPLFSPFTINNFTFKNRLGVAPMTRIGIKSCQICNRIRIRCAGFFGYPGKERGRPGVY